MLHSVLGALRSRAFSAASTSVHQACRSQALAGQSAARAFAALPCEHDDAALSTYSAAFDLPQPRFPGLLLDAAGTLLTPSEPAAEVYLRYAKDYGCQLTEREILRRFRRAYNTPWGKTGRRYIDDGRDFWRHIVGKSTGCTDAALAEEVYQYFARAEAWSAAPQAVAALSRLRDAGVKLAVVSNFDTRLRPLLSAMQLDSLFDAIVVSAEVGAEKPNPVIFEIACEALGVQPNEVVHVGDDRRNDVFGARDAGCFAWLYGLDVLSMEELADRVLWGSEDDDMLRAIAQ